MGRDPTTPEEQEAAIENAWRVSGDLHVIADRLATCRERSEPPPEWVHKALLDLADAKVDTKPYVKEARDLVRYIAVREAHVGNVSWPEATEIAAEKLRGSEAKGKPEYLWKVYQRVRKKLHPVGGRLADDDPGYRWIDLPDKAP